MNSLVHDTSVGPMLRRRREQRGLSQLGLALQAEISTRHLSFVETGRSTPSREMVLHLADHLDVTLRDRNDLLTAAGYAPLYAEAPLGEPPLRAVREAIRTMLRAQEPFPAAVEKRAALSEHGHDVRNAARHHGRRTRDRVFFSGRRRNRKLFTRARRRYLKAETPQISLPTTSVCM